MQYHIGLDFGTCQTKVCVYDLDNKVHEFFKHASTDTYFLPSRIGLNEDSTFEYGALNAKEFKKEFHYFKIAAVEDEEFYAEILEVSKGSNAYKYDLADFEPFTPAFLSVLYLTNLLFVIKDHYKQRKAQRETTKGFINKLFARASTAEETKFTIQIGIPTEWSQKKNLRRKRKFENILIVSELLQKHYQTLGSFQKATSGELLQEVKKINESLRFKDVNQYNEKLHELGISVFPETAAGLTFILKTRQLLPGYYAIMDIGGGTTDVSFFCVETGHTIKYLASESYIIAANNVYKLMANSNALVTMQDAEKLVHTLINSNEWEQHGTLTTALIKVREDLNKLVYKLFHKRVYFFKPGMVKSFADQPILMYGGGSRLPCIKSGKVLIYDNGNRHSITIPLHYMEKHQIDQYTSVMNVLPEDGTWKSELTILIVALGLSYVKPDSYANWFGDEEYQPRDGGPAKAKGYNKWDDMNQNVVQHPHNEDYYIYDVLVSKWK